jgi:hypothetical protein
MTNKQTEQGEAGEALDKDVSHAMKEIPGLLKEIKTEVKKLGDECQEALLILLDADVVEEYFGTLRAHLAKPKLKPLITIFQTHPASADDPNAFGYIWLETREVFIRQYNSFEEGKQFWIKRGFLPEQIESEGE